LLALFKGEEGPDAKAGAFAVAEFIHLIRAALTSKK
jgi:hypothetical protein